VVHDLTVRRLLAEVEELDPPPEDLHPAQVLAEHVQGAGARVLPFRIGALPVVGEEEVLFDDVEDAGLEVEHGPEELVAVSGHDVVAGEQPPAVRGEALEFGGEPHLLATRAGAQGDADESDCGGKRCDDQLHRSTLSARSGSSGTGRTGGPFADGSRALRWRECGPAV
jgi:hypothetical protein